MANRKEMPDLNVLIDLLEYNKETGVMMWKERGMKFFTADHFRRIWNTRFSGKPALCSLAHNGYLYGAIFGENYSTHRIAWYMSNGVQPIEVDHINGDRADNRLVNLRNVDRSANCRNVARSRRSVSGVPGVVWRKETRAWVVHIGKERLGQFKDFDEAVAVRKAAEANRDYHPNHGREAINHRSH